MSSDGASRESITRIYVTGHLPEEARRQLGDHEVFEKEADRATLAKCQVLIAWPWKARRELLQKMTNLKMVQTITAGVDDIDFSCIPPEVLVYSNAGAYTESVAEHGWGLLLGLAKGLHVRRRRVVPRKLRGGTLLVLGCGAIGSEIAKLSRSLDMKTVGVSRSFKSPEFFDRRYKPQDLGAVVGFADAVVIALPLNSQTRGVLHYETLMRMNDHVTVVNVGRGETVSEEALIRWLKERPESRYATDVFWKKGGSESFESAAWELENFAGTLHISGLPLGENLTRPLVEAARNVARFIETGDARNRVDRADYL